MSFSIREDTNKEGRKIVEWKMVDCVHWSEKKDGNDPWEENPENCNNCENYVLNSKIKILDSKIMDEICVQDSGDYTK